MHGETIKIMKFYMSCPWHHRQYLLGSKAKYRDEHDVTLYLVIRFYFSDFAAKHKETAVW